MWNQSKKCIIRLAAGVFIFLTLVIFLSRFEHHLSLSSMIKSTLSRYRPEYDDKPTIKGRAAQRVNESAHPATSYLGDNSFLSDFNNFCVANVNSRLNCTITLQQAGDIETGVLKLNRMLYCLRYNILTSTLTILNKTLNSPNDKNVCGLSKTNSHIFDNLNLNERLKEIDEKYSSRVPRIYIDREFWDKRSFDGLYDNVIGLRLTVSRLSTDSVPQSIPYHVPAFHEFTVSPSSCELLIDTESYGNIMPPCNGSLTNLTKSLMMKPSKYYRNEFTSSSSPHAALYIIRDAVVVPEYGRVFTAKYAFETSQCNRSNETDFVNIYRKRKTLKHMREVFVTTQLFSVAIFHYMAEAGARIAPYLEFLKQHPNIKIHAPLKPITTKIFTMYGLEVSRIVPNTVWADIVYLPQGGGCGGLLSCIPCLQIAYQHFRRFQYQLTPKIQTALDKLKSSPECNDKHSETTSQSINFENAIEINRNPLPFSPGKTEEFDNEITTAFDSTTHLGLKSAAVRSINRIVIDVTSESNINAEKSVNHLVLIKRTGIRALTNHCQVESYLKILAQEFGLVYLLFPDKPLPNLNTTLEIYRRAMVVVAPHGAGLTNLVFAPHGTFVVEVLERQRIILCFQTLSYQLGHRWHGLMSSTSTSNLTVDMTELDEALRIYLNYRLHKFSRPFH